MAETHLENMEELNYDKEVQEYKTTCLLNVREEPSLDSPILNVLQPDTIVEVVDVVDGWAQYKDGGYSLKKYLK